MSEHTHVHEQFTAEFWDQRYRSAHTLWSGNPNPHLTAEAGDLPPGAALDAGAGEGADAIWLARRGWQVTAIDISTVALERAAGHAAASGGEIAARIRWRREDLLEWQPPERAYDLVTAQFLHLPTGIRQRVFARLAAAVAGGGTLLIAGHHPADLESTMPRPNQPELFFTGGELASELASGPGGGEWEVVTNVAAAREATDPEGRPVTIHDTVFRARRA